MSKGWIAVPWSCTCYNTRHQGAWQVFREIGERMADWRRRLGRWFPCRGERLSSGGLEGPAIIPVPGYTVAEWKLLLAARNSVGTSPGSLPVSAWAGMCQHTHLALSERAYGGQVGALKACG